MSAAPKGAPTCEKRVQHGYHDTATIRRDLSASGFSQTPEIQAVAARSRAASARIPAMAHCQGTPIRSEIESRDPAGLDAATEAAETALAVRFGRSAVDGKIQAQVTSVAG